MSEYVFEFDYDISSEFIKKLILENKVSLIFIVYSIDSQFKVIPYGTKEISFPKNRLSLKRNTKVQLQLQTNEEISFKTCTELTPFYDNLKEEITVPRYSLIGYSEIETYLGSSNDSITLFESSVNPNIKSAFEVELGSQTITLVFRNAEYALNALTNTGNLQNMYFYIGLAKALGQFVNENLSDSPDEEYVDIDSVSKEQSNDLNQKLLDLMINKGVQSIGLDNIDEVIDQISDQIIERFVNEVKEVAINED